MRTANLMGAVAFGLLAGAAIASDPTPPSGADARWRAPLDRDAVEAEAATPGPPAPVLPERTCAAFEDENYGGRRLEAHDGAAMEWVGRAWNNRISSVACAPGCRLIAYHAIVFGGARANFTGARPALGPVWNDRISALRIACDGAPADAAH